MSTIKDTDGTTLGTPDLISLGVSVQYQSPIFDLKTLAWIPFPTTPHVGKRPYLISASLILTTSSGSSYTLGPTLRLGFGNGVFTERFTTDLAITAGTINGLTGVANPIRSSGFTASANVRPIPLLTDYTQMGIDLSVAATGPAALAGYVEMVIVLL